MLVVFFAVMIFVGFYTRKHATDVTGFVLGGRSVGPWPVSYTHLDVYKRQVMYQIMVDRFYNGDKTNDVVDNEYVYIGKAVTAVKDCCLLYTSRCV